MGLADLLLDILKDEGELCGKVVHRDVAVGGCTKLGLDCDDCPLSMTNKEKTIEALQMLKMLEVN